MAPVPEEKAAADKKPSKPSPWKVLATGFDTVSGTVGFVLSASAFIGLISSFLAHLKMTASKRKAKKKVEQLEREAEEAEKQTLLGKGAAKLRKRDIKWDIITQDN